MVASDGAGGAVRDNAAARRYELPVGEEVALIAYRLRGDAIDLIHTEVPEAFEGRGIAARLARHALDDARARGLRVIPSCPYIAAYIRRRREYGDLVGPPPAAG